MNVSIEEIGRALAKAKELDHLDKALCLLWFSLHDGNTSGETAGSLASKINSLALGNPNSTSLKKKLSASRFTISSVGRFRLKQDKVDEVKSWISPYLEEPLIEVDQAQGFLPGAVWKNTRPYIENVAKQVNGCFQCGFYDASHVMVRRLIETLIIESYSKLGREQEIKQNGDFAMLGELINRSVDQNGLALGREAKKGLKKIKELGDRSAHNRYFAACKADLEKIESEVRVAVDELISIASLRSST